MDGQTPVTESGQSAPRICVVGSANTDLFAYVPRLPQPGETLIGTEFKQGFGGKGSNQAVMAAKLGAAVTMVAKLGADDYGRATVDNYRRYGIDTQYVAFDPQRASGVAPITVGADGRNMIVVIPGANDALTPEDVRRAQMAIEHAHIVICQCEAPDVANLEAFRIARAADVRTILNPAPARPLPSELLDLTDVIVPNETETELLTGMPVATSAEAQAAARELQQRGVRQVIITLGERGALVLDGNRFTEVPAMPVTAVDSSGAGDAFIGSMACYLAAGHTLEGAVAKASAVAALSVTRPGTQSSFPSRDEVDAFLVRHSSLNRNTA